MPARQKARRKARQGHVEAWRIGASPAEEQPLPSKYRDHALKGQWHGMRDAHIEPDWLLIYYVEGAELHLVRTGTHADVFDE